ncbi:MAG: trypsin-like peptidase domain-containing protein [Planctomycetes bacterium]|nr:trypsin-like peptidase domain-containing protein [Planctomycetota bacterium]
MKSRRVSIDWRSSSRDFRSRLSSALVALSLLACVLPTRADEPLPEAAADLSARVGEVYTSSRSRTVVVRGELAEKPDATTSGTGAVLAPGLVVTCAHVVEDAANLEIVLPDGRRFPARRLGMHRTADIALLAVEVPGLEPFPIRTGPPEPGEWVLALGHPGGAAADLEPAPAVGRVLSTGYNLTETGTGRVYNDMVATDVPIFQGNSGGPLVDLAGNLVGMNAAISVQDGLAYAVPSARILEALPRLRKGESIETPPVPGRTISPPGASAARRAALAETFRPVARRASGWIVRLLVEDRHLGHGVILSPDGVVLAPHFLVEPYRTVQVRLPDGDIVEGLVGAVDHRLGLAAVRVARRDLAVPELAPRNEMALGRIALSLGTDRRVLGVGLVGSLGREVTREKLERLFETLAGFDLEPLSPPVDLSPVLQHDTPLAVGDLGSPLVDLDGRLLGINVSNTVRGATYAAPAYLLREAARELAAGRDVLPAPRPFLGLDLRELTTAELGERKVDGGLLVTGVLPGFCAERAGVLAGDLLIALGGSTIRVPEQLAELLSSMRPGNTTAVRVLRDGRSHDFRVTLDSAP